MLSLQLRRLTAQCFFLAGQFIQLCLLPGKGFFTGTDLGFALGNLCKPCLTLFFLTGERCLCFFDRILSSFQLFSSTFKLSLFAFQCFLRFPELGLTVTYLLFCGSQLFISGSQL